MNNIDKRLKEKEKEAWERIKDIKEEARNSRNCRDSEIQTISKDGYKVSILIDKKIELSILSITEEDKDD